MSENVLLAAALAYADLIWPIIPIHEPKQPWCSCGKQCDAPGKHPRNGGGVAKATTDKDQIERWWKAYPNASIAVATGPSSGLWVVTVGTGVGQKTLARLEQTHGPLPKTLQATSGGGSRHFFFRNSANIRLPEDFLGDGIKILSKGRYVILPPSRHQSGESYAWDPSTPLGVPIEAIPNWVTDLYGAKLKALSEEARKPAAVVGGYSAPEFDEAVTLYNNKHIGRVNPPWSPFPETQTACPMCPGVDTFRSHPNIPGRWICTSPEHVVGGNKKGAWFTGDVLEIDATQRSRTRKQHLEDSGYWGAAAKIAAHKAREEAIEIGKIDTGNVSKSFAGLCVILETPSLAAKVLRDRKLRFNMMSGRACLDDEHVTKFDVYDVRRLIEQRVPDKRGDSLLFGNDDVRNAIDLASKKHEFHPVRDYLDGLCWDKKARVKAIPKDILRNELEVSGHIFYRWMISAVARAYEPGCQVDSMLVLYGLEGVKKSSFFRALGGKWYAGTMMDPRNKDALHQIRSIWIYEWQEMDALQRTRDSEAAKAFLTDPVDHYRPSHEPDVEDIKRNGIFCGSTNVESFLTEMTGDRRFWPITCPGEIEMDIDKLKSIRDQLWAEAVDAYKRKVQWWLTPDEKAMLAPVHASHRTFDIWEDPVLKHLEDTSAETITVSALLGSACKKETGQWTSSDQKRVSGILKANGWEQAGRAKNAATNRSERKWVKKPEPVPST